MARLGYDPTERGAAVARAERWTERQAARLGYRPDEILAAVRRGWFPDQIETLAVANAEWLALTPAKAFAAKLRAAPVVPVNRRVYFMEAHERYVTKAKRAA
jgi:hypothetical protein